MYKHLLVTLDGSQRAESVIPHALGIARSMKASITLLRVIDSSNTGWGERGALGRAPVEAPVNSAVVEGVRSYLERVAAQLQKNGVDATLAIRQGPAAKQIIATAQECDADVIAMATHSRTGINKLVFGSVAEEVLHESSLPVLLVRAA